MTGTKALFDEDLHYSERLEGSMMNTAHENAPVCETLIGREIVHRAGADFLRKLTPEPDRDRLE